MVPAISGGWARRFFSPTTASPWVLQVPNSGHSGQVPVSPSLASGVRAHRQSCPCVRVAGLTFVSDHLTGPERHTMPVGPHLGPSLGRWGAPMCFTLRSPKFPSADSPRVSGVGARPQSTDSISYSAISSSFGRRTSTRRPDFWAVPGSPVPLVFRHRGVPTFPSPSSGRRAGLISGRPFQSPRRPGTRSQFSGRRAWPRFHRPQQAQRACSWCS